MTDCRTCARYRTGTRQHRGYVNCRLGGIHIDDSTRPELDGKPRTLQFSERTVWIRTDAACIADPCIFHSATFDPNEPDRKPKRKRAAKQSTDAATVRRRLELDRYIARRSERVEPFTCPKGCGTFPGVSRKGNIRKRCPVCQAFATPPAGPRTAQMVLAFRIRRDFYAGDGSLDTLARRYGVHKATVSRIVNGKRHAEQQEVA